MKTTVKVGKTLNGRFVAINPEKPQTLTVLLGNEFAEKETNVPLNIFSESMEISDNPLEIAIQFAMKENEAKRFEFLAQHNQSELSKLREWQKSLTPAKLRKMLKTAEEKSQAQKTEQKILKSVEKICKKLDKKAPARPLKGKDYVREDWKFDGHNKLAEKIWAMIPNRHKDSVAYRRTGGYFGHTRVISPEASQALKLDGLPK